MQAIFAQSRAVLRTRLALSRARMHGLRGRRWNVNLPGGGTAEGTVVWNVQRVRDVSPIARRCSVPALRFGRSACRDGPQDTRHGTGGDLLGTQLPCRIRLPDRWMVFSKSGVSKSAWVPAAMVVWHQSSRVRRGGEANASLDSVRKDSPAHLRVPLARRTLQRGPPAPASPSPGEAE